MPQTVNLSSLSVPFAPATKSLLGASDFTYLGKYQTGGSGFVSGKLTFGRTLTHRYVGGQLRFLSMGYGGSVGNDPLYEFTLPAGGFGGTIATAQLTGTWAEIFSPALSGPNMGGGDEHGLWWDEAKGGLWCSQATDYPGAGTPGSDTGIYKTSCVTFRQLSSDGTINNFVGKYGFQGIGQRAIGGGVRGVPASWQSSWEFGPYLYGFGGYTSLMAQGYGPSLGLMLLNGPDVTTYPSPTAAIPLTDWKIAADHRTGCTQSNYNPSTGDRGVRLSQPANYFDGGDPRNNPVGGSSKVNVSGTTVTWVSGTSFQSWWAGYSVLVNGVSTPAGPFSVTINGIACPVASYVNSTTILLTTAPGDGSSLAMACPSAVPTVPPQDGAHWLSPSPDGKNRWVWDDSYNGSVVLVDGPNKYGLVAVANLLAGECYYSSSTLHGTSRAAELHVFDPADLQACLNGTKQPWAVQPAWMRDLTTELGLTGGAGGNAIQGGIAAATFDSTTNLLWLWEPGVNGGYTCYLHCYQVNC